MLPAMTTSMMVVNMCFHMNVAVNFIHFIIDSVYQNIAVTRMEIEIYVPYISIHLYQLV